MSFRNRADMAFRTLFAPWVAVLVGVLEVANLQQRGAPWRGDALWTTDWLAISLFVAGPLLAAAVAVDASRLTRPGMVHLTSSPIRTVRTFGRLVGWGVGPAVTVHLLAFFAAHAWGRTDFGSLIRSDIWLGLLVHCVALVWYAALGTAVGRFVSPPVAGIAGAFLALGVFYALSSRRDVFNLFDLGGATIPRLGIEWSLPYLLTQIAVLGATALLLIALPVSTYRSNRVPSLVGAAALVLIVGSIAIAQSAGPAQRNQIGDPIPPDYCYQWDPTICFYDAHSRFSEPIAVSMNELFDAAERNGYEVLVPERVEERSWAYTAVGERTATFEPPVELYSGGRWDRVDLVQALVQPAHCAELRSPQPPPEQYWTNVGSLMLTWLSLADVDWPALNPSERILSAEEVATVLGQFDACDIAEPLPVADHG